MKINNSISDDNAYDFSEEGSVYFDSKEKVLPVKAANLIVKI